MAKSVNKVILLGNVGKNPEMKTNGSGTLRTMVSLATSDRRKVNGEWKEFTDWHNLVFFGRTAEIARDYLLKGSKIYVEGKLHTYSYTDDSNTTRWRTDVQVNDLTLISGTRQSETSSQQPHDPQNSGPVTDDDIPF